jgi:ATP-dependent DNA ligase
MRSGVAAARNRRNEGTSFERSNISRTKAGILFNEHIAEDGPTVFAHACRLGAEGIVSERIDSTYRSGPCRVWIKVRNRCPLGRVSVTDAILA